MNPEKCKRQRKELGLSQKILAEKIGSYQMAISRYEKEGYVRKGNLIEKIKNFFGDSSPEKQFERDAHLKSYYPTKEEASKFQIGKEVIKLEGEVSVGTLIGFKDNYLLVSPEDPMSNPEFYNPRYFKPKKSK